MRPGSHLLATLLTPVTELQAYRSLLFLLTGLPLGIAAFTVLVTGWALVAGLVVVTPVAILVLIALRFLVFAFAKAEGFLARELLGTRTYPTLGPSGVGFWQRGVSVLVGRDFWRQQGYLVLRVALGFPLAVVELALISVALQALAAPVTYRWDAVDLGVWTVDSFGEALLLLPAAPVVVLVVLHLARPFAARWRRIASRLLSGESALGARVELTRAERIRALTAHAAVTAGIDVLLVVIWALTSHGYFWPLWPILALGLPLGIHSWVVLVLESPAVRKRAAGSTALAITAGSAAVIEAFLVATWAVTSRGYFWPVWPLLGLAIAVGVQAVGVFARREYVRSHRIEELETTRAGAVDVQESELRRIERDLHDGAQARLVALGMSIGMAEEKLRTDPEGARALLAEARAGAREALEELRDLARGIHPPILSDRGLEAAIAALVAGSRVPVALSVEVPERPPATVETAAYFVVSEALTNAVKYADATHIDITIQRVDGVLVVEVVDDGKGGADPSGTGLTGLRQRVAALDGALHVESPAGGPTRVRVELPCA